MSMRTDWIFERMAQWPERQAMIRGARTTTYADLLEMVAGWQRGFAARRRLVDSPRLLTLFAIAHELATRAAQRARRRRRGRIDLKSVQFGALAAEAAAAAGAGTAGSASLPPAWLAMYTTARPISMSEWSPPPCAAMAPLPFSADVSSAS